MKTLSDGTKVPSRVYYYLLDYCQQVGYHTIPQLNEYGACRLADLSNRKLWELFTEASKNDLVYQVK